MPSLPVFLWAVSLLSTSNALSSTLPVDDPRACPWDIKICGDGTWVYRLPERDCAFGNCWVRLPDEAPATIAQAKPEDDLTVTHSSPTLPPEPTTPEGEEGEEVQK